MKKMYSEPLSEKLEFDYKETIVASSEANHHGDIGVGYGRGGGCDHNPYHGNPHKQHP